MKRVYAIAAVLMLGTSVTQDSSSWRFVEVEGAGYYWQNQSVVSQETVARAQAAIDESLQTFDWFPERVPKDGSSAG
jgi:hypothetical protein